MRKIWTSCYGHSPTDLALYDVLTDVYLRNIVTDILHQFYTGCTHLPGRMAASSTELTTCTVNFVRVFPKLDDVSEVLATISQDDMACRSC